MSESLPWVDADDLLRSTGARNVSRSGNEITFSCGSGAHAHGDATPSAGMNAQTTLWRCRSPACGLRGNAVDYLVAFKELTRSEAVRVLSERYGGPERSVEAGALEAEVDRILAGPVEEEPRKVPTRDEYHERFAVEWPLGSSASDFPDTPAAYMLDRGFYPAVLNSWQIGFDGVSDRITIPVFDVDGELVGIKGRAWRDGQTPKYLSLGDVLGRPSRYGFHTYQKSRHVFGLNRLQGKRCVVCEGELNAIALDQMEIAAVAVAGAEFSKHQRELIVSHVDQVVIYFDPDDAGRGGMAKVAEMLDPFIAVSVIVGAPGDAAETPVSVVHGLIAGAIPLLKAAIEGSYDVSLMPKSVG